MKRITCLLLTIGFLCCLPGCGTKAPEPTIPETAVTTSPPSYLETDGSTEPLTDFQLPLVAVSLPPMDEVFTNSEGIPLLRYTYQDLQLTLKDPLTADAIALDFLNWLDPMGPACSEILQDAKHEYQITDNWSAYIFKRLFTPMRLDNCILSMYGVQILSGGTGAASSTGISLTYEFLTGQRLSLKQVLREDFSTDALSKAVVDALSPAAAEGTLYDDYATTVHALFSANTPVENWYLSENGLCFYFDPYEIAPYSAGTVVAEVPYDSLFGILKDSYFPEEEIVLTGFLIMEALTTAQPNNHERFAELILDRQGTEYLIHVTGAVDNLRLEVGSWQPDGSFIPENTVFSAAALTSGDALMVQLQESMIDSIRITYLNSNMVHSVPLSSIMAFG